MNYEISLENNVPFEKNNQLTPTLRLLLVNS